MAPSPSKARAAIPTDMDASCASRCVTGKASVRCLSTKGWPGDGRDEDVHGASALVSGRGFGAARPWLWSRLAVCAYDGQAPLPGASRRMTMAEHDHSAIKEDMPVVGADGVHVGTVDHLDGERIKLTKADSVDGKHHYLPAGLVAAVEGDTVRLSANAANSVDLFEEAE